MKKRTLALAAVALSVAALQTGCHRSAQVTEPSPQPAAAEQGAAAPEAVVIKTLSGKVTETMTSGGYTYMALQEGATTTWAAVPAAIKIKVGDEVTLKKGMVMENFVSKTLDRKFPEIVFAEGLVAKGGVPVQESKAHGAMPIPPEAPSGVPVSGKVVETMDAGGYTYVNLEKEGKSTWVALPITKLTVGQQLAALPGAVMTKFTSKTLNRTFETILFSPGVVSGDGSVPAAAPLPAGHPAVSATRQAGEDKPVQK